MINLHQRVPFRILQRLARRWTIEIGGRRLTIPLHSADALEWLYWKETALVALLRDVLQRHPGAFVDVGVNVGQTLAGFIAAGMPGRYVGIEPNLRCASFASEVVQLSGLEGVEIIPVGLWKEAGLKSLMVGRGAATDPTASFLTDIRSNDHRREQWAWTMRLDELLPMVGDPEIGLLKVDVEGAELEVLQGAAELLERRRPPILCEVLLVGEKADLQAYAERVGKLMGLLHGLGYTVYRIKTAARGGLRGFTRVDAFPLECWTHERADECDYLFVPEGFGLPGM